jgi:hypothetical protein
MSVPLPCFLARRPGRSVGDSLEVVRREILDGEQLLSRSKEVLRQALNVEPVIATEALALEPEVEVEAIEVGYYADGFCGDPGSLVAAPRRNSCRTFSTLDIFNLGVSYSDVRNMNPAGDRIPGLTSAANADVFLRPPPRHLPPCHNCRQRKSSPVSQAGTSDARTCGNRASAVIGCDRRSRSANRRPRRNPSGRRRPCRL